jgi:hypothetical protein
VQKLAVAPELFIDDGIAIHGEDPAVLAPRLQAHLRGSDPLHSCFLCNGGQAPLATQRQLTPFEVREKRESLVMLTGQVGACR